MRLSKNIILTTLNAAYIHSSLGLRYLLANMGDLKPFTVLREFTVARRTEEVAGDLLHLFSTVSPLKQAPPTVRIIGFGVYIWNVRETVDVIKSLRQSNPEVVIVVGGPEVSYETNEQEITRLADYVITGWGDLSFPSLCRTLIAGQRHPEKVITGAQTEVRHLEMPYAEYTDDDILHRIIYVEASRGCPFSCEFCLSALDTRTTSFDIGMFLGEVQKLYERGARHFKFIDRTFNLKIGTSIRILDFFLEKLTPTNNLHPEDLFLHFEVVPDRLPDELKTRIEKFPVGVLQLEIGIQSLTPRVQRNISRRQNNEKALANLHWLREKSQAHLHTDLLFGLPGETLESFGAGFDSLYQTSPHEIQLGILKRLRGTPIHRHTNEYGMVYDTQPPYQVIATNTINADTMKRVSRFSRYWDLIANSGRFRRILNLLLSPYPENVKQTGQHFALPATSPFKAFLEFSDWLWQRTEKTHEFTPELLVDLLYEYMAHRRPEDAQRISDALLADYQASGARGSPKILSGRLPRRHIPLARNRSTSRRQTIHRPG